MTNPRFSTKDSCEQFVSMRITALDQPPSKYDVARVVNEAFVYSPDTKSFHLDVSEDYFWRLVEVARL